MFPNIFAPLSILEFFLVISVRAGQHTCVYMVVHVEAPVTVNYAERMTTHGTSAATG